MPAAYPSVPEVQVVPPQVSFSRKRLRCIGWPAPVTNPQKTSSKNLQTAPAMMLVNSLFDPGCFVAWATGVATQASGAEVGTGDEEWVGAYESFVAGGDAEGYGQVSAYEGSASERGYFRFMIKMLWD
jgi:hypothetical protein